MVVGVSATTFNLSTDLTHYWAMDTNSTILTDSVGSMHLTTNATNKSAGLLYGSYLFNNSNTYYSGGDGGIEDFTTFTTSLWIYPNSAGARGTLLYTTDNSGPTCQDCNLIIQQGDEYGTSINKIVLVPLTGAYTGTLTENLTYNAWNHVVVSRNSSGDINSYINNHKQYITNMNYTTFGSGYSNHFYLGRGYYPDQFGNLRAKLDEVAWWTRALSDDEITSLYNDGIGCADWLNLSSCWYQYTPPANYTLTPGIPLEPSISFCPINGQYDGRSIRQCVSNTPLLWAVNYTSPAPDNVSIIIMPPSFSGVYYHGFTYYYPGIGYILNWTTLEYATVDAYDVLWRNGTSVGNLPGGDELYDFLALSYEDGVEYYDNDYWQYFKVGSNYTENMPNINLLLNFVENSTATNFWCNGDSETYPVNISGIPYFNCTSAFPAGGAANDIILAFPNIFLGNDINNSQAVCNYTVFYQPNISGVGTMKSVTDGGEDYVILNLSKYSSNLVYKIWMNYTCSFGSNMTASQYIAAYNYTYIGAQSYASGGFLPPDSDGGTGDDVITSFWESLLGDYNTSLIKMIMGFVLIFGLILFAAFSFGKYGVQLGTMGIMIFTFLGVVFATLLGLLPIYVLILILVGGVLLIILKQMLFPGTSSGD